MKPTPRDPLPDQSARIADLEAEAEDHWDFVLRLQRLVDSGGGVPADIPLWARVDCLIKQRDGRCPIPDMRRFGRDPVALDQTRLSTEDDDAR